MGLGARKAILGVYNQVRKIAQLQRIAKLSQFHMIRFSKIFIPETFHILFKALIRPIDAQAGLSLCFSHPTNSGFLMIRPIMYNWP